MRLASTLIVLANLTVRLQPLPAYAPTGLRLLVEHAYQAHLAQSPSCLCQNPALVVPLPYQT